MQVIVLKDRPELKRLAQAVGSKKHKAFLPSPVTEVSLNSTYWDGGSRNSYYLVEIASGKATPLPHYAPVQYGGPAKNPVQAIEVGYAVVECGVFCGKPSTPTIYLHPAQVL